MAFNPKDFGREAVQPAAAYAWIADALPETYFQFPPPKLGIRLVVSGVDGVKTQWDLPPSWIPLLAERLRGRPLVVHSSIEFDDRQLGSPT